MNIEVNLLEGFKVQAQVDALSIIADQPALKGGSGDFPSPYEYFLASIGLCAGYYIQSYCRARNIETKHISIVQKNIKQDEHPNKLRIELTVNLPEDLSEKDRMGIMRSIEGCTVKKAISAMPDFVIKLS